MRHLLHSDGSSRPPEIKQDLERFQRSWSHPGTLVALDSFAGRAIWAENRAPLFLIAL